jgi:GcrA cell cycle regulator
MVTVRLMMAGKVGPADVKLAAASIPVRTDGGAKLEPPAPLLVTPAPAPAALVHAKIAALAVCALTSDTCHWPVGDPRRPDFCFCSRPTITQPYCERHRVMAYLPQQTRRKTPSPRFGVRYASANLPKTCPAPISGQVCFPEMLIESA